MSRHVSYLSFLLLALTGCDDFFGSIEGPAEGEALEHPCFGNRTDALWHDDALTAWVGCGSTTEGYGLFRTTDGGEHWEAPSTDPAGVFDDFRVSSIHRSADGLLYVAGTDTSGGTARAISLSEAGVAEVVYASQSQTWNSFHVGTFRRNSEGLAVAESLTGADLTWRPTDEDDWEAARPWSTDGTSHQLLDMTLHDDAFYGAGSTITEPHYAFLPARGTPDGFELEPVQLAETTGELWGIGADDDGLVLGGVDQDRDVGVLYTGPFDGYAAEDWSVVDLGSFSEESTWIRGACRGQGLVVGVGEYSRLSEGLVLVSTDGGQSFQDRTPEDTPSLHRCVVLDDGRVALAGAEGFYMQLRP